MAGFEAFEVASVLKIADEATAPLTRVLALARDIEREFDRIKVLGKGLFTGTGAGQFASQLARIDPTLTKVASTMDAVRNASVTALGDMDTALIATTDLVRDLKVELTGTAAAARAMRIPSITATAGGRGGHTGGGSGGHISTPNIPLAPGTHFRTGGGPALGAAAVLGYGIYEQAELDDAVARILFTEGESAKTKEEYEAHRDRLEKRILDLYKKTGMPLPQIEDAAHAAIRQMAPFPAEQRESILDKVLPVAAMETRLKGGDLAGNAESIVGLLHMSGFYKPDEIDRLLPAFTYASLYDPQSIQQMVRAAGYAIPSLRTMTGVDPVDTLNMVALLQSAGISSTKAGTWIEGGIERLMPNTVNLTSHAAQQHMAALRAFGLIDDHGKSTIMGEHGLQEGKALALIASHLSSMPIDQRAGLLTELGMRQGSRFLALATDPTVMARSQQLMAGANTYGERQGEFWTYYDMTSTVQKTRTTMADFNSALIDVAKNALPAVTAGLDGLDTVLKHINDIENPTARHTAQLAELAAIPAAGLGLWALLKRLGGSVAGKVTGSAVGAAGGALGRVFGAIGLVELGRVIDQDIIGRREAFYKQHPDIYRDRDWLTRTLDWAEGVSGGPDDDGKSGGLLSSIISSAHAATPSTVASAAGAAHAPLGIRSNNPGNLMPRGHEAVFATPQEGLSAMAANLRHYGGRGWNTIDSIIGHWAPASDPRNNVPAYIADVVKRSGFLPGQHLNLNDPKVLEHLMPAIVRHEQGMQPYSADMFAAAAGDKRGGATALHYELSGLFRGIVDAIRTGLHGMAIYAEGQIVGHLGHDGPPISTSLSDTRHSPAYAGYGPVMK